MLDAISETISHFIGYFHLSSEEMRLRLKYDQFRHEKAKADDIEAYERQPHQATAYDLKGFDPGLNWRPVSKTDKNADKFAEKVPENTLPENLDGLSFPEHPQVNLFTPKATALDFGTPSTSPAAPMEMPPPASLAFVAVQSAMLDDNDVLGDVDAAGFAAPEVLALQLDSLVEVAQDLSALELPRAEGDAPWMDMASSLEHQIASAGSIAGSAPEEADVTTVTGEDASGIYVNGEVSDDLPELADHMPAFLMPSEEDGGPDVSKDFPEDHEDPQDQPDGHLVVAGGNAAINETHVQSAWLDAKVIVVAGDVTQAAAINQVNVLSDVDSLNGAVPQQTSSLVNAAQIERTSAPAESAHDGHGLPLNWAVTRIDGDLVDVSWFRQTTFTNDHDRAVITSKGTNTYVGLGGNEVVNTALLTALGYQFDLIMVGGDLYDISVLTQWNVLLDDDYVSGGGGDVSGGDNLLFNSASLVSNGVDTFGEMTSDFASALDAMVDGVASMPGFLAQNGLLMGAEILRVLYVSGDLVRMTVVEQINVVGDNDQIEIAIAGFSSGSGADVSVVTGSNLLANIATVEQFGMDSTILAGGEIYSDALIHQAGFVDLDAAPTGVSMPALANEAVAFLADDMIAPAGEGPDDDLGPMPIEGGGFDVMQTMLA